jgi:hypothetical protein
MKLHVKVAFVIEFGECPTRWVGSAFHSTRDSSIFTHTNTCTLHLLKCLNSLHFYSLRVEDELCPCYLTPVKSFLRPVLVLFTSQLSLLFGLVFQCQLILCLSEAAPQGVTHLSGSMSEVIKDLWLECILLRRAAIGHRCQCRPCKLHLDLDCCYNVGLVRSFKTMLAA